MASLGRTFINAARTIDYKPTMVRGDLRAVMNAEDGWTIHNAYEEMHDAPTAWAMLQNPHDMGCY